MAANDDYDYIIKVIQYLDRQFNIHFFINSKDFDVLYRWWEKRIPFAVVSEALRRVVERRLLKKKPIISFSVFSHEVRLNYQSFLSLNVGRERIESREMHGEIKIFLSKFPGALNFLQDDFARLGAERMQNGAALLGQTDQFRQDRRKIGGALQGQTDQFRQDRRKIGGALQGQTDQFRQDRRKIGGALQGQTDQFRQDRRKIGAALRGQTDQFRQDRRKIGAALLGQTDQFRQDRRKIGAALRGQTDQFRQDRRKIGAVDAGPVHEKLLRHFQNDAELNAKCAWFLKNLAPDLRSPEIEKKYRLNYLLHKFAIPSFD